MTPAQVNQTSTGRGAPVDGLFTRVSQGRLRPLWSADGLWSMSFRPFGWSGQHHFGCRVRKVAVQRCRHADSCRCRRGSAVRACHRNGLAGSGTNPDRNTSSLIDSTRCSPSCRAACTMAGAYEAFEDRVADPAHAQRRVQPIAQLVVDRPRTTGRAPCEPAW